MSLGIRGEIRAHVDREIKRHRERTIEYRLQSKKLQERADRLLAALNSPETKRDIREAIQLDGEAAALLEEYSALESNFKFQYRKDQVYLFLMPVAIVAVALLSLSALGAFVYISVRLGLPLPVSLASVAVGIAIPGLRKKSALHLVSGIVESLWSQKTYSRVFKPAKDDLLRELQRAQKSHKTFQAWWIKSVRGPYSIIEIAVRQAPWSAIDKALRVLSIILRYFK